MNDARREQKARYDRGHTIGIYLKLNTKTDADILYWISDQTNKQGAIKSLIRAEIENKKNAGNKVD